MIKAWICTTLFFFTLQAWANNPAKTLLYKSIKANHQSKTYGEWEHHPHHPEKILQQVFVLDHQQVCDAFVNLKFEEFLIFYVGFTESVKAKELPCYKKILFRTKNSMQTAQQTLHAQVLSTINDFSKLNTSSKIIYIDPTNGPDFYDASLPEKTIALTFDDGPHPVTTPKILRTLSEHNLTVNFFSVGKNIKRHSGVVKLIASQGHLIGNHSWDHKQMSKVPPNLSIQEIIKTYSVLDQIIPHWVGFFRYPYGSRQKDVTAFLKKNHIANFYWNIDTLDWKIKSPQELLAYSLEQIETQKKGIVLFHDVQPQTTIVIPALIDQLKARGYSFVAFDEKLPGR